jgi:allantoin racemase
MRILYQLTSPMHRTLGAVEIARRRDMLKAHASPTTELAAEPIANGPATIESARDAGLVIPELIRLAPLAEQRGYDAVIIGCFGDPGLDALRELIACAGAKLPTRRHPLRQRASPHDPHDPHEPHEPKNS